MDIREIEYSVPLGVTEPKYGVDMKPALLIIFYL